MYRNKKGLRNIGEGIEIIKYRTNERGEGYEDGLMSGFSS
jgi:hypothetical protein